MNLSLDSNFLKEFLLSKDSFAILDGRVHTLHMTNGHFSGENFLQYLGKKYALEEAEEIHVLEQELFEEYKAQITDYMSWVIQSKILSKIDELKSQVQSLGNVYDSIQDNSVERFIMVDVFNAYNHENRNSNEPEVPDVSQFDDIPTLEHIPGIEDLNSSLTSLEGILLQNNRIIVLGGRVFRLRDCGNETASGHVKFAGCQMAISYWRDLSDLMGEYEQRLLNRIEAKALEHGKVHIDYIKRLLSFKSALEQGISSKSRYSGITSSHRGKIGFQKSGSNRYRISISVNPFLIEKEGKYFAFGNVDLGIDLEVCNNSLQIVAPAVVLNMHYRHPFVHSNGSICYTGGTRNRWDDLQVKFNDMYSLKKPKTLAKKIAQVMRQAEKNLETGYYCYPIHSRDRIGNDRPVHWLEEFTPIATSRTSAESYCSAHGIAKERIFQNG